MVIVKSNEVPCLVLTPLLLKPALSAGKYTNGVFICVALCFFVVMKDSSINLQTLVAFLIVKGEVTYGYITNVNVVENGIVNYVR
jgi:hypothetical protein